MKILMLCLGNICRSPIAEGLMQAEIDRRGLDWEVDSAGTSSYHAGDQPDSRSIEVMEKNGYDITYQRSRPFESDDFDKFDLIFCMDKSNVQNAASMARIEEDLDKLKLILDYHPNLDLVEVPDPYFENNFQEVYEMIKLSIDKFINAQTSKSEF